jgi:predicted acylesterase/phospholipase RssA
MARRYRVARLYRPRAQAVPPLKIGLVLSGAVALGSFEAGVVHELLSAVGSGAPLTVDVIVGSSAGALVGAMTAKSLVTGAPFAHALRKWTEFTLTELTHTYETPEQARARQKPVDKGILSTEAVRRILEQYLVTDPVDRPFQPAFPAPRVVLAMTLTNLDGLAVENQVEPQFAEGVIFRFAPPDPHRLGESPFPAAVWRRVALVGRASAAFPGAFDPDAVPWADRISVPGLLEEFWENDPLLERLHRLDPSLQPKMRYADGGILDEQPMERAITLLPYVTGGQGEAGLETLVYDPRRCLLFVEPDPPATSLDALKAGTPQSWFAAFTRSLRLLTLSASPVTSQKRVVSANTRQERLFHFLSDLARRMREESLVPTVQQILGQFRQAYPESALPQPRLASGGLGEPSGLIDPILYQRAIRQFYQWLRDEVRFQEELRWLDQLPPGRIKEAHKQVRAALVELREAYLSLEGVDPVAPGRYQAVLEEVHASLAESLGLSQPWVALHQITPDDPRQMLKGEEIIHFGGFFSEEFLRHDFEVGRYYAHQWLTEAIPGYAPSDPPVMPPVSDGGLNWRLLWANRGPLWRIAGRLVAVTLEEAGLIYGGPGQLIATLLWWSLLLSLAHGILLVAGAWLGWITFPPQYQELRFWLLLGTSLFPLTFGLVLGLSLRRNVVRVRLRMRRDQR